VVSMKNICILLQIYQYTLLISLDEHVLNPLIEFTQLNIKTNESLLQIDSSLYVADKIKESDGIKYTLNYAFTGRIDGIKKKVFIMNEPKPLCPVRNVDHLLYHVFCNLLETNGMLCECKYLHKGQFDSQFNLEMNLFEVHTKFRLVAVSYKEILLILLLHFIHIFEYSFKG
jgi:hypothetical protein